ncbi:hypothetical protein TgHK011_005381 [Trichoderma gracile]|nr:hypothetical protein TgHK011_005381 [Trichoderma gracile]
MEPERLQQKGLAWKLEAKKPRPRPSAGAGVPARRLMTAPGADVQLGSRIIADLEEHYFNCSLGDLPGVISSESRWNLEEIEHRPTREMARSHHGVFVSAGEKIASVELTWRMGTVDRRAAKLESPLLMSPASPGMKREHRDSKNLLSLEPEKAYDSSAVVQGSVAPALVFPPPSFRAACANAKQRTVGASRSESGNLTVLRHSQIWRKEPFRIRQRRTARCFSASSYYGALIDFFYFFLPAANLSARHDTGRPLSLCCYTEDMIDSSVVFAVEPDSRPKCSLANLVGAMPIPLAKLWVRPTFAGVEMATALLQTETQLDYRGEEISHQWGRSLCVSGLTQMTYDAIRLTYSLETLHSHLLFPMSAVSD